MLLLPVASTPPGRLLQRAARQHHQPVEAERYAAGLRHRRDGCEKLLVERITLAIAALFLVHRRAETTALFGGVGQFAKAVGELDAAGIDLETFGHARIGRLRPRQRRLGRRIFEQHRQPPLAQMGLDMLDQHLAENVRPGVITGDPYPPLCRLRKRGAITLAIPDRRQQINVGKAFERGCDRQ